MLMVWPGWPLQLHENQRLYVIGWKAPLSVLDAPEWADAATGRGVTLASRPYDDPERWQPVVTTATDEEGWQYATVFK
jgi:hypothetical protein